MPSLTTKDAPSFRADIARGQGARLLPWDTGQPVERAQPTFRDGSADGAERSQAARIRAVGVFLSTIHCYAPSGAISHIYP
jgi:hypothetical protein